MGGVLEISLYVGGKPSLPVFEAAFAEAERIEGLLSPFQADSELCRLNRRAAQGPVEVGHELMTLLRKGLEFARLTEGALDFTVVPLMRLWGFRDPAPHAVPPTVHQVQEALERVGCRNVLIGVDAPTVQYRKRGCEIEFGALGKGYALDQVVGVLKDRGVTNALVSFGSTAYALGRPPEREGWRLAIRHPRQPEEVTDVVVLKDCALSTSGDYEQGLHILDPRTGYPAIGTTGVSVIAPTALEADAFSTAALVLGGASGLGFLERRAGVEGMLVGESASGGLLMSRTEGWGNFCLKRYPGRFLDRRWFLGVLLGLTAGLLVGPSLGYAVVYLTEEEALKNLIPQARRFRKEEVSLTRVQKERVRELLGNRVREKAYTFWIGEGDGGPEGYAVRLNVVGKERPITFMVAVSPEGKVLGAEVLVYRESQGSEVRSGGFMGQFVGKTLDSPLKLGRDIDAISGATLSSRSTAYAVKKALALMEVVYRRGG